jgi:hypothetical protein
MNQSRAETLRRRIEVYRRCLHDREPSDPILVSVYLSEIAKAELEIAELEKRAPYTSKEIANCERQA